MTILVEFHPTKRVARYFFGLRSGTGCPALPSVSASGRAFACCDLTGATETPKSRQHPTTEAGKELIQTARAIRVTESVRRKIAEHRAIAVSDHDGERQGGKRDRPGLPRNVRRLRRLSRAARSRQCRRCKVLPKPQARGGRAPPLGSRKA